MRTGLLVCSILLGVADVGLASGGGASEKPPQVIVLKFDDAGPEGAKAGSPVSPRWARLTDFLERKRIKASYGIIGYALEKDSPAFFQWVKTLHAKGNIEFWNHGYRQRKATDKTGEFEGPLDQQIAALRRTQALAKEKLGIELKAFGPHWSGATGDTEAALRAVPEIAIWFYGPKGSRKYVFERVLTLENPTFVPDFDKFRDRYEKAAHDRPCLALQGHPNAWDEKRWQGFVKIIEYLQAKGCRFMTPSEYWRKASRAASE